MERAVKAEMVTELKGVFKTANTVVVAHYAGLTVAQMQTLRRQARQATRTVFPGPKPPVDFAGRRAQPPTARWRHRRSLDWAHGRGHGGLGGQARFGPLGGSTRAGLAASTP